MNNQTPEATLHEPARDLPIAASYDVIVCGGGPAGVAAALAAGRSGARTLLVELHGCLGGVWTAGALSWIIDHENKGGIMAEILAVLQARGYRAMRRDGQPTPAYDTEGMKLVLEELCGAAGVTVRLSTRVAAALCDAEKRLTHIITESKSGREAWNARAFIDATGDGDLGALAGCGFDRGRPENGEVQPMTLMALVAGVETEAVRPYINGEGAPWGVPHRAIREEMERGGHSPSYHFPTLFRIREGLFALMANHQYGVPCDDAAAISAATIEARGELHRIIDGLRALGGVWSGLHIVATAAQIGVREGRRIHGRHTVTVDELVAGARHADAVCRATFCVDIHSTNPARDGKGLGSENVRSQPYDIPLRALIARDVSGLLLAGRCISGDFLAHGSYRVTGNAVAMGEAAGRVAACAALTGRAPHEVSWDAVFGSALSSCR